MERNQKYVPGFPLHPRHQPAGQVVLHMKAVDGWHEGFEEVIREGEVEDVTGAADGDFNFIKNDVNSDNIYLL